MNGSKEFTIEAHLGADTSSVFEVLTDPSLKSRWLFGAEGVTGKLLVTDVRTGGVEIVRLNIGGGSAMMIRSEFLAVAPTEGMSFQSEVKIRGRLVSRSQVNLTILDRPGGCILRHREICEMTRPPETVERRKDLLRWLLPQIDAVAMPAASNVIWLDALRA